MEKRKLHEKGWTIIPILAIPVAMFLHEEFLVASGKSLTGFLATMVINQFGRKRGCAQLRYVCKTSAAK